MEDKETINQGISTDQLDVVMQYASGLYNYLNGYNGLYTPWTQNELLKGLNNAPIKAKKSEIDRALSNPLENESLLGSYSEFMKVWDTIYSKTLNYYSTLLSFDYRISAKNVKDPSMFKDEEYLKDKQRFYKFMDKFDYKTEFLNVLNNVLRTGKMYTWMRTTEGRINDDPLSDTEDIKRLPKYVLQTMPQDVCKITGRDSTGFLYDLDMTYWLNPSVDINLYAPDIKQKFKKVFSENKGINDYYPNNQPSKRDGTYVLWTQTSPDEGAWVFVWDTSNPNAIPPFANLMRAVFDNDEIHRLQMNKNISSAYALLHGEIGLLDGAKSGEKVNNFSISPDVMGQFMQLVQSGLKEIMKTVALPLTNTKFSQYEDKNADMETKGLDVSSGQGAFANSLIYSSGKKGQAEVINGLNLDYQLVRTRMYKQFSKFVEFYGNKKTKKYKFNVVFDGSNIPSEKEERRNNITQLANMGFTLNDSAFAQAFGYDPQEFESMMMEASQGNLSEYMMLPMNANTMTKGEDVGNPKKSESQLSDAGATSQEYE